MSNGAKYWFWDGSSEPLCEEVSVLTKTVDLHTGEEALTVRVHSSGNGLPFDVSRDQFEKKNFFNKLTLHGLSIIETKQSYAEARYRLHDAELQATIQYEHHELGFRKLGDFPCFLAYRPIGNLPPGWLESVNPKQEACLKPRGSFLEWKAFIRKYIVGNTERSLALMLGATAPIAYILKSEGKFPEVPIWTLVNRTSSGKTTSLFLIASMYANPRLFIDGFNATSNALYAMLEERGGYPFLCDEATHVPHLDWDSMIYTLPSGKEKRRCDAKGKLKPPVEFGGSIIMTSEASILARSKGYGGEECRIIEFELDPFAGEPEVPELIKEFTHKNYGWATEPIITYLLDPIEKSKLKKKYSWLRERLIKSLKRDISGVDRRIISRYALILVAGWVLKRTIHCNFDLKAMERYLIRHYEAKVTNRDERDDADKLVDRITGFVNEHREKFPTVEELTPSPKHKGIKGFWGARGFYGAKQCIWIEERILKDRILPDAMLNATTACKTLHSKGYMIKFYDRTYHIKQKFGGINASYYCLTPPKAATLFDKIEDASSRHRSLAEFNADLAEGYDKTEYEYLSGSKLVPSIALCRAEAQSFAIHMNREFASRMRLSSRGRLYAVPIPAEKIIIFSRESMIGNSMSVCIETQEDGYAIKGLLAMNLIHKLGIDIPEGYQAETISIEFSEHNDKPVAVVSVQEFSLAIEPLKHAVVDYKRERTEDRCRYSDLNLLLQEDDE